jgi:phage baseplate assembly protein W
VSVSTPAPLFSAIGGDASSLVSSNTAVEAFPTIPIEDDPTPADTAGFALTSDIADFNRPLPGMQGATQDPSAIAQQYGYDLSFDFGTGEPMGIQFGQYNYVSDQPQVFQWIEKALETPQGLYVIYDPSYGSILKQLIGEGGPDATMFSEVSRTSQECMAAHPRVQSVSIDAVFRNPLVKQNAIFTSARLTFDTTPDPVAITVVSS